MKTEKKKKKKLSGEGKSTREKMLERKKKMSSGGGGLIFPKDGTVRFRVHSRGSDEEIGIELVHIFLNKELGSVISPETFGEPCPFIEKYKKLIKSKKDDDKLLAKKMVPKTKYAIPVTLYEDLKGKKIDTTSIGKGMQIPKSAYQDLIDLYLDEDDWGDLTDPRRGYDVKLSKQGSGLNTEYSLVACPKTKADSSMPKVVDLESIVRGQIKSYDELEELLERFLNDTDLDDDDDEDDDRPKKKKKKGDKDKKSSKLKKKELRYDEDDDLPF